MKSEKNTCLFLRDIDNKKNRRALTIYNNNNYPPMNQNYPINYFMPSESTLSIIRQYAHSFRTLNVEGKYIPVFLN